LLSFEERRANVSENRTVDVLIVGRGLSD